MGLVLPKIQINQSLYDNLIGPFFIYIDFKEVDIMMKLFGNVAMRTLAKPNFSFSVVGNTHLEKDAEVNSMQNRTLSSKSTQSLITLLMLLSLEPEVQDLELLLV